MYRHRRNFEAVVKKVTVTEEMSKNPLLYMDLLKPSTRSYLKNLRMFWQTLERDKTKTDELQSSRHLEG